jgi:DNA modification methylase
MTDYLDRIICGDCLEVMASMSESSVDSIVTDPPYGLSFMGKDWDHGVPGEVFWREALRVAKPGAHLLAFGGTRTHHRLICAIEDAGWEIRDCLGWLYGSGFPKSLNLKDKWQGWGTALKPAWEPIVLARKPLIGTVAQNVLEHGTGALNIDGCRVETEEELGRNNSPRTNGTSYIVQCKMMRIDNSAGKGRFPANLIHDGSNEVEAVFPKNASRFFYCAKASTSERGEGNNHPTVKPQALMQYLCRLVTPPGGVVLDPFTGSGSTLLAALREGFCFIGIEQEEKYCEIARRRVAEATPSLFAAS